MRNLTLLAAGVLSLAAWAPAGAAGRGPSVPALLAGAELRIIDVQAGGELGRGRVAEAALAGRCTLRLRTEQAGDAPLAISLGDLRFVQGDDSAMVEISSRREPRRSLIFTVGADRYAATMEGLTALARRCGAALTAPPPLVATRPLR